MVVFNLSRIFSESQPDQTIHIAVDHFDRASFGPIEMEREENSIFSVVMNRLLDWNTQTDVCSQRLLRFEFNILYFYRYFFTDTISR